jgi:hypothetical protein
MLLRSNTVVCCESIISSLALPPWMAFIWSAWPRTKGLPSRAYRSASQVPGKEAFDPDHEVLPIGSKSLKKRFRPCLQMLVEQDLSILVQHAQVHATSMSVNTTVKLVWLGVESPEVSS